MKDLIKKLINKETITYLIFGVLTTVVSFAVYTLLCKLDPVGLSEDKRWLSDSIYNVISWIAAVTFAFVTNKLFVFESKSWKAKVLWPEILSFVTARLLSLGFETGFIALTVKFFNMNDFLSKIIASIFVVILNYFASKFLIFRKKTDNKEGSQDV